MTVTSVFELAVWKQSTGAVHFIFDEGEQVIKKHLVNLTAEIGFQGLYSLKWRHMYFFSATCHNYWLKAFLYMFSLRKESSVFEYPT